VVGGGSRALGMIISVSVCSSVVGSSGDWLVSDGGMGTRWVGWLPGDGALLRPHVALWVMRPRSPGQGGDHGCMMMLMMMMMPFQRRRMGSESALNRTEWNGTERV